MRPQPLAFALALSLAPVAASAGSSLPPQSGELDQATEFQRNNQRRKPADCHRDVRTHRIGGVMVTHRHVGDRCQVRVVRKLNSF